MSSEYSIYSPFDPDKHKDTYKNYLEVLLLEDGSVVYAIPSHQEKAMALACERLGVTRELICDMCPIQYYADFLNWLLSLTNSVSVWNNMISCWSINKKSGGHPAYAQNQRPIQRSDSVTSEQSQVSKNI